MFAQKQKKTAKHPKRNAALLAFASLCASLPSTASPQSSVVTGGDPVPHLAQAQKATQADDRQKKMEGDAARLVEMAQQLKLKVDKTNKNVLSVDVVRDAERIEKLAREVRESMRQ